MMKDPIVEEMRNAGRKMQEECGNDLHKYFQMIRESEKRHKKEGWKFVDKTLSKRDMNLVP